MPVVRYQVDDVHADAWAHAFFPTPGLTPAGQSSLQYTIHGYPGTMQVDSPSPRFDWVGRHLGGRSGVPGVGYLNGSDVAPNWIAPQIWWNDIANIREPGLKLHRLPFKEAQLVGPVTPLGTVGPLGPSRVAMGGRKIGGRRGMKWPRPFIRWPNLKGQYGP